MNSKKIRRRGDRYVLADFRRLRQRSYRGRVSASRHRIGGRVPGIWLERRDDGLCHRPYLGMPSQPCSYRGPCCRRTLPDRADRAIHHRSSDRCHYGSCAALCDRQRRCGFRRQQRVCIQRIRGAFAGQIQPGHLLHNGSGDDSNVPLHHHGGNPWQGAGRFCASWPLASLW